MKHNFVSFAKETYNFKEPTSHSHPIQREQVIAIALLHASQVRVFFDVCIFQGKILPRKEVAAITSFIHDKFASIM